MRTTTALIVCLLAVTAACSDSHNDNDNDNDSTSLTPLLERYTLSSSDSVPEGVAFDPGKREFYATSLQGGGIVRINAAGEESVFRASDNRARLVGAKVDAERRRLWVCAQAIDGGDNRVWVFDLDNAELTMEFFLGAITPDGSCNDLVLDSAGVAYVTDPSNPFIYRLDAATGSGAILATNPLFADISNAGLGLNGIALTPDETALIVARFLPASLLRVSLPEGSSITPIALTGDALPSPDGLAVLENYVYAVSGERVSRVRLNSDFSAGEVVNVPQKSGLSTATIAESQLYVIKSEVVNFVLMQSLNTPFEIFRVDTLAFEQ